MSCLLFLSSCSDAHFSWSEIAANCSDWLRTCSDAAASFSVRTPFWYSRSCALDSTRSHSRWARWIFFSERFLASLSFSFSTERGSIHFISWRRCSATQDISCNKFDDIIVNQCQQTTSTFPEEVFTLICFITLVREVSSLLNSLVVSSSSTITISSPCFRRIRTASG